MPYSFLEHTADVRMKIKAKSREELFSEALRGLIDYLKPVRKKDAREVRRKFRITSPDETALLVDFLSEALRIALTRKEAYHDLSIEKLSRREFQGEFIGRPVEAFQDDIKAVTYHEARLREDGEGLEAHVVFDI